jgi:hypothetical protein
MLKFYQKFEINDASGDPLTDRDMMRRHYASIVSLQVSFCESFADSIESEESRAEFSFSSIFPSASCVHQIP